MEKKTHTITEYVIVGGNDKNFIKNCGEVKKKGYLPLFGHAVVWAPNEEEFYYTQMWSKTTNEII